MGWGGLVFVGFDELQHVDLPHDHGLLQIIRCLLVCTFRVVLFFAP